MKNAISLLKQKLETKPLLVIMIVAIIPRLIATIFAKGYGMHDDAFGPVESMQTLLDDFNFIYYGVPKNLLYPIFQYFTFAICEFFNIFDPQSKMYVVRLFHALYSLFVVYLGYKITLQISTKNNAKYVGIVLSLLWMLPYMSVRNLVEVAVIPPMLAGVFYVLKSQNFDNTLTNKNEKQNNKYLILAGIFLGIAFYMRFQTGFVPFGIGLVLLYLKQFKSFTILAISAILIASLFFIIPEYIFWDRPFGTLIDYLSIKDMDSYPIAAWYMTILLVIGVLIPPMSLLFLFGFLRNWKKHLILFIPVLIFIIFHSIYPNKQERFILTIIPLLVILCVIGWNNFIEKSKWWNNHKKLLKANWIWFWSINTILLLLFIFSYSKRTRVESFTYLSHKQVSGIVIEMNETGTYFPPLFYLGENKNKPIYLLYKGYEKAELLDKVSEYKNTEFLDKCSENAPNYAIFFDENDLTARTERFEVYYDCKLILNEKIEPGLLDEILHFTNPKHNRNYTAFIYKIN